MTRVSAARAGYNLAWLVGLPLAIPWFGYRIAAGGKYRSSWRGRLGALPPGVAEAAAAARASGAGALWLHAVSVGEVEAVTPLAAALRERFPAPLLLSTATETGQALARQKGITPHVFYFPLDLPWLARRVVRRLSPAAVVITETELWPNFAAAATAVGARQVLVNARISDRSYRGYRRWRGLSRELLGRFAALAAQTAQDAERLVDLGAPAERVVVCGNLKFDASLARAARPDGGVSPAAGRQALGLGADERLWIAGSTHPGEEEIVLEAHRRLAGEVPGLRLLLAPRHVERAGEIERLAGRLGLCTVRRSRFASPPADAASVILLDTIGELSDLYRLAELAFIGGSLVPVGGHNPLEALVHGVPVLFGPLTHNFREIVVQVIGAGAGVRIEGCEDLARCAGRLLASPGERAALGERGRRLIETHRGATKRCLGAIEQVLGASAP